MSCLGTPTGYEGAASKAVDANRILQVRILSGARREKNRYLHVVHDGNIFDS